MKSKTLVLVILFLSVFQTGKSQHAFPSFADSAKWSVLSCNYGIGVVCNTFIYQYAYDTTFCGHLYSKINITATGPAAYIRSDNSHVYLRTTNTCFGREYLMYDFSMNVGDTVYLAYQLWNDHPDDTTRFVLDSSNTINFHGVNRRICYVRYEPDPDLWPGWFGRNMTWIEGIGSMENPFFPLACIQDYCESSWRLLCYDSLGVQLYQDTVFNTCDTAYTELGISEQIIGNQLNVFPNPFDDQLTLSVDQATFSEICIYNGFGKCVFAIKWNKEGRVLINDIHKLPSGIYFIKAQTDKGHLTKKIVKIE